MSEIRTSYVESEVRLGQSETVFCFVPPDEWAASFYGIVVPQDGTVIRVCVGMYIVYDPVHANMGGKNLRHLETWSPKKWNVPPNHRTEFTVQWKPGTRGKRMMSVAFQRV